MAAASWARCEWHDFLEPQTGSLQGCDDELRQVVILFCAPQNVTLPGGELLPSALVLQLLLLLLGHFFYQGHHLSLLGPALIQSAPDGAVTYVLVDCFSQDTAGCSGRPEMRPRCFSFRERMCSSRVSRSSSVRNGASQLWKYVGTRQDPGALALHCCLLTWSGWRGHFVLGVESGAS